MQSSLKRHSSRALSLVVVGPIALAACGGGSSKHGPPASTNTPPTGESSFSSAPPGSEGGAQRSGSLAGGGFGGGGGLIAGTTAAPANAPSGAAVGGPSTGVVSTPRTVQETDLYRLEGTRLYYLNSYRGLMVFDVSNVDSPALLGRAAIFGDPKDMVVSNGIATVVIGDWYGLNDDGTPFHGSIVRGFDATDPTNIKVLGDAKLGGYVRDDRVVGHVLYAVSQEEPSWVYGWPLGLGGFVGGGLFGGGGIAVSGGGPVAFPGGFPGQTSNGGVIVSSVDFSNGQIKQISSKTFDGYGGIFNVTSSAILLAHPDQTQQQPNGPYIQPTKTDLVYLDISDPGGNIVQRGTLQVDGVVGTWGPDNGRWNLDFADGKTAHVVGSPNGQSGGTNATYILATGDFTNPDAPAALSELTIPGANWVPAARFEPNRMYLSPDSNYYYNSSSTTVPIEVFDLSNPAKPQLAGQTQVPGSVWLMIPSNATRLFALGRDETQCSSPIALNYLDVTDPTKPMILGTSTFGEGWASTPAQGTFKAFVMDPNKLGPNNGLVLLPFSGWDAAAGAYNNGVQLIEFTPSALSTGGAAHTKGWGERGIFVGNRVVSLSDLALSVVDYSNPANPQVTAELTLARSVSTAQPTGSTIAEVSSDFWDNDKSHSDVRILPISDAEEKVDESGALDTTVGGINPRVFTNGNLDYIVTDVQVTVPCNSGPGNPVGVATPAGRPGGASCSTASPPTTCAGWQQQIQVVDLSNGGATLRGQLVLPIDSNYYGWSWGWYGCYAYDWYNGGDVLQVGKTTLAFRRWNQNYAPNGQFVDTSSDLYVVDLSNPDKPDFASLVITKDPTAWWGNMRVIGDTLYTTHTEWIGQVVIGPAVVQPKVHYWLDRIDLSDPKNPRIESSINVPGVLVGGSASDPTLIYTINYYYDSSSSNSNTTRNEFDVLKVYNGKAYLQSQTSLDGYVGHVIVADNTAYMSASIYPDKQQAGAPSVELHQIDLSNPSQPVDRVASDQKGWGWLLAVEGDRAMVTSGWGQGGLDIYKLTNNAAPVYDQFVRTRGWGWGTQSLSRQNNQLFVSSGYWGVQAVTLQ